MDSDALIEKARKLLVQGHQAKADEFKKASLRGATIVVLENERKKARYEIYLDTENGEYKCSRYHSPSTE